VSSSVPAGELSCSCSTSDLLVVAVAPDVLLTLLWFVDVVDVFACSLSLELEDDAELEFESLSESLEELLLLPLLVDSLSESLLSSFF
jgi:hypothetical protein